MSISNQALTEVLASANGFKLSSLPANQRGELTREQIPLLYGGLVSPLIFTLFPGGFLIYQIYQRGVFGGESLGEIFRSLNTSFLVIGGILAALTVWGLILLVQAALDITGGQVASVEDVGFRQARSSTDDDGSRTTQLYYQIGGFSFRVKQRAFAAFEDERSYRAYFTPRRKALVNIEAV